MSILRRNDGMTLVELMVAIGITSIVMTMTVPIFVGQHSSYNRERFVKESQESGQAVVEMLRGDLLQAGWSVLPEMAFYFKDGDGSATGGNKSDTVVVNDTGLINLFTNPSARNKVVMQDCPGGLKISGTTPGTSFTVPSTAPKPFDIDGDDKLDYKENKYVISDTTDPTKKIAVIQSAIGSSLACKTAIEGSYVAPTIYYCADDGTNSSCGTISDPKYTLKRSDRATSGLQPITGSIVDLQVAYEDTDDFWYGTSGCSGSGVGTSGKCSRNPFDPTKIKLVRLSVVTRSWEEDQNGVYGNRDRDQSRVNDPNYCRPAVENRTAATVGGSECGYIYRVYTVLVQPRSTGPLYAGN